MAKPSSKSNHNAQIEYPSLAEKNDFNQALCQFLDASPTPFHATESMVSYLDAEGFKPLAENKKWSLKAGEKYYVSRNQSSLIAWTQGKKKDLSDGLRLIGAHTDSPCLRVKPSPDLKQGGSWRLGVEVYGGALLNPWFDRDLSIAGRVHYQTKKGGIATALIDFKCPIATIPSLAIHLDREANNNRKINAQNHLPVLLAVSAADGIGGDYEFTNLVVEQLKRQRLSVDRILDHELSFYDTQKAGLTGINGDFIASARLDNLLSCFIGMHALLASANNTGWSMLVCNDHEEVGSASAVGAAGAFLPQVLQRILPEPEEHARAISQSLLISTDNAHAAHPNYPDKSDPNHSPKINGGPVIKINANQRYASNSETQALFRQLCMASSVPVQNFVMRSDMACGSTIGPITAAEIGIRTLDVGIPTYAMHSIRELAGSDDPIWLGLALQRFLQRN